MNTMVNTQQSFVNSILCLLWPGEWAQRRVQTENAELSFVKKEPVKVRN